MTEKVLTVVFDGEVLRPDTPIELEPNTRYRITIQEALPARQEGSDAWSTLESLTGTIEAPRDWAHEHDHYLYGTPKRESKS